MRVAPPRRVGTVVWVDLSTTDIERAIHFYERAHHPLVEGTRIRLTFHEDGGITAYAGCNTLGGSVEVGPDPE